MAVELRTLRVSAQMDEANYVAGAKAVEASSASAGKAVSSLGATVQQTDTKISQSGDVLARLSRQYVDGYAAAQRAQQAVASLSRGIDSGRISMAQAEPILEGIYRKYGQLGSGAEFAAKGQMELGAAIDRTTAKMVAQQKVGPAANDNEATFRRRNLNYQLFDVTQGLALGMNPGMIAMQQGPQILQLYAGQGGVNAALKDAGELAGGLARRFWPVALAAAAGSAAIVALQGDIEKATGKSVSFGDVAGSAMKLIADDIYQYIKPAVEAIAPWFDAVWDSIKAGSKEITNLFIAGWMVQIDALKTGIGAIPDAFIAAGEAAANGFLHAMQDMVQEALVEINSLISKVNGILRQNGIDYQVPYAPKPMSFRVDDVDIGGKAASERLDSIWEDFKKRAAKTFSEDFVGTYFQSLVDRISSDLKTALPDGSPGNPIPIPHFRGVDDVPDPTPAFGVPVGWGTPQWQTDLREDVKGFFSEFRQGLTQGKNFGEALGDAILNALTKRLDSLADKSIDQMLDSIFDTGFRDGRGGGLKELLGYGQQALGLGASSVGAANDNGRLLYSGDGSGEAARMAAAAAGRVTGRLYVGTPAELAADQAMAKGFGGSNDIAAYIRQAALARGIDPEIAVRVARSEGGLKDPFRQGESMLSYGREESYGPFQLHMRNGGVGARALAAGIDPRTNWRGGVDYGLDEAANKGWGQWFGAARVGIGNREGLEGAHALGQFTQATREATVAAQGLDTGMTGAVKAMTGAVGNINFGGSGGPGIGGGGGMGGMGAGGGLIGFFRNLFGFAGGTDFAPGGLARINERGGEIVDLPRGTRVIPHDVSMAMARGAANSNSVTVRPQINIQPPAGYQANTDTDQDDDGNERVNVTFSRMVASEAGRKGSPLNRQLGRMGASEPMKRRS